MRIFNDEAWCCGGQDLCASAQCPVGGMNGGNNHELKCGELLPFDQRTADALHIIEDTFNVFAQVNQMFTEH